jgi:16S rRNA processing protein RimM
MTTKQIHQSFDSIGTVGKPHGLKGEFGVRTQVPYPEQLLDLDRLYISGDFGMLQPYSIRSSRMDLQGKRQTFFVFLEMVADRNAASAMMGKEIFIEAGRIDLEEDDPDNLTGYRVIDMEGNAIGEVLETMENPAHPILRTRINGKGEVLIPFVEAYVYEIDDDEATVTVVDIEGLLEL